MRREGRTSPSARGQRTMGSTLDAEGGKGSASTVLQGGTAPLTRTAAGAALPGAGRLPSPPPHAAASTRTSTTAPHALADGEMTVPEGLAGCRVPLV